MSGYECPCGICRAKRERDEALARVEQLEAALRRGERFLRNGSGYREEIAVWLADVQALLSGLGDAG